jgi:hypothetical protein
MGWRIENKSIGRRGWRILHLMIRRDFADVLVLGGADADADACVGVGFAALSVDCVYR